MRTIILNLEFVCELRFLFKLYKYDNQTKMQIYSKIMDKLELKIIKDELSV